MATTALSIASYGIKYQGGFTSPMREKLRYEVYISERDYTGEVYDLPLTGDRIVITQGAVDDPETKPFKPSAATLSVLCREENNPYLSLYTLDPTRYLVNISECRIREDGTGTCLRRWSGYISTGVYSQPNARAPYDVTIECNDGLEILKNTPYALADGSRYEDTLTVRDLILRLLEPILGDLELWPYMPIDIDQVENTFDLVAIPSAAIYGAAGGDEIPSHYQVLESILTNFGLQMFQCYGRWCVRALSSLSSALRPDWYDTANAFLLNNLNVLPLYDDNGGAEGISTDAMITMRPPLRKINVSSEARSDIHIDISNLNLWGGDLWGPWTDWINVYKGTRGVRLRNNSVGGVRAIPRCCRLFNIPGLIHPSNSITMTLYANLYNLEDIDVVQRIGILAVEPTLDDIFSSADLNANKLYALGKVSAWNFSENKWQTIPTDEYSAADELFKEITTKVNISKSKKEIGMNQKVSLSRLSSAELSIQTVGVPDMGVSEMRIVILISGAENDGKWMTPAYELADVEMSVATNIGQLTDEKPRSVAVSRWGADDIELKEYYVSGIADAGGRGIFAPTLIRMADQSPVRAFLNPSSRTTATEAIAGRLRSMRNDVTLSITGEVYKTLPIDMNTVWRSRDQRFFYANCITWRLYRGIYDMELCELLPMRTPPTVGVTNAPWTNSCAMDNGIVFRTLISNDVYHIAPVSAEERLILSTANETFITSGHLCACVLEVVDSANSEYRLYAYDDNGSILSKVESLYAAVTAPSGQSEAMAMAKNARYDASTSTWVVAGNVEATGASTRVAMLDTAGALLAESTQTLDGRLDASHPIIAINGGFVLNIEVDGWYKVLWHNSALHEELELVSVSEGAARCIAVNDSFVVSQFTDNCVIRHRKDATLATDKDVYRPGAEWSFVAMNNALLLFRNTAGDGLVYDVRTGGEVVIETSRIASQFFLVGDIVYILGADVANALSAVRIIEGDGYYGLIDSNGAMLYDSKNIRLMAKKYDIYN